MSWRRRSCGWLVLAMAGCGSPSESLPGALPSRLSETGLFADVATRSLATGVMPYSPQYPLWSDGAHTQRWLWLPPGTSIDGSDPDAWVFPAGTRLWKEFAFEAPVETRFMERQRDGSWRYSTYRWLADRSDAVLVGEQGERNACESAPGVPYDVPARTDCTGCHAAGRGPVLGVSALQLSTARDPLAVHAEPRRGDAVDLGDLVARELLRPAPVDLAPRIVARTPRERAALGYLQANCGHCHHADGALAWLGLALGAGTALASTLDVAAVTAPGERRLIAGDAAHSHLVRRMAAASPLLRMPPLGTRRLDDEALELLRGWIDGELSPRSEPAVTQTTKR